ncbi:MAG: GTP-binding protein [Acutalibacteraceae bacterium]|nr:GTP-binding protein [Acutalibacteraceae bacterium]
MSKGLLKFITCGSVDDGKSTLIGHILYDSKLIYADQERALELDSKVGSRSGSIDYSLLLDGLMAEREQGITIDVAYRYFTTKKRSFIVADTPGHEEYTRNMAVGASFADLAVILVDASQGVLIQTKRHARICKLMGIRCFVFAVNKMDLVKYSEVRFNEIDREIKELSKELKLDNVKIIPLSATEGDNVTSKSENISWYRGEALLPYLEKVDTDTRSDEKGFYLPVQRVCRPDHTFRGFQGQIESGEIHIGEEITILPGSEKANVRSILVGDKPSDEAFKGQPVTITLDREVDVSRGSIITSNTTIGVYKKLIASILWMDDEPLEKGREFFVKIGTKTIPGVVTKLLYIVDINTGEHIAAGSLSKNGIALCEITLTDHIPADRFADHKTLGALILIDRVSFMTSACGVVEQLEEQGGTVSNKASFKFGNIEARGDIFEEFVYDNSIFGVTKYQPIEQTYTVGDEIPLTGKSYRYPQSFDIIVIRDSAAIKVRQGKITQITSVYDYVFEPVVLLNGRGFELVIKSQNELDEFLRLYAKSDGSERDKLLAGKLRFDTYRSVAMK